MAVAQPEVQVDRRAVDRGFEPLRQICLEDVAGVDVLDDARHGVEVALAREIRSDTRDAGHRIRWSGRGAGCGKREAWGRIPHLASRISREHFSHENESTRR